MKNWKKLGAVALGFMLFTSGGFAIPRLADSVSFVNYRFEINEERVTLPANTKVMSLYSTTYVPLRFISENLGATVKYDRGLITITDGRYMRDLETGKAQLIEADRKKLDQLEKELDKVKKENESLKKQISVLEKSYSNVSAFKTLPANATDAYGLDIRVDSIGNENSKAVFNIVITNNDKENIFTLLPERTEVVYNESASSKPVKSTTALSSTLVSYTSGYGLSNISGDIAFDLPYQKDAKGSITFYYRVNGNSDVRSMTINYQTKK